MYITAIGFVLVSGGSEIESLSDDDNTDDLGRRDTDYDDDDLDDSYKDFEKSVKLMFAGAFITIFFWVSYVQ